MTYQFGKAVAGGTPLGEAELTAAEKQRLEALYDRLRRPQQTEDVLDQRLAEELEYSQRLIEIVVLELTRRGGVPHIVRQLADAKAVVGDVAKVVGAYDRCEGVALASNDLKRRLMRESTGNDPLCRRDRLRRGPAGDPR